MIETIVSVDSKAAEIFMEKRLEEANWHSAERRFFRASHDRFSFEDLTQAIETISLFSPRIVVTFEFDDQSAEYMRACKKLLDIVHEEVFLFIVFSKAPKMSTPLMKKLKKKGPIHRLDKENKQSFDQFLEKSLLERNLKISSEGMRYLKLCLQGDYKRVEHELDKLALLDREKIAYTDLKDLIHPPLEEDVFALSNAISAQNRGESFRLYHDLKKQGVGALQLTGLMASNVRRLYQIALLYEAGYREKSIASMLSLSERQVFFLVNNRLKRSHHFAYLLNGLAEIDQKVKMGLSDEDLAFSTWIIEMTQ